jgi:hypothetical protein
MKQYTLKAGPFDRARTLTIAPDKIRYDEFDLKSRGYNEILKSEVADFKYIAEPIRWDLITVGRKYTITIKDRESKLMTIRFKNFFWQKNHYDKIFTEVITLLWEHYFKDVVDQYLIRFYEHQETVHIGKLNIHQQGIDVAGTGLNFTWEELEFKAYTRFFVLSKRDKPEFHIWIDYYKWHTEILYSLIKTIVTEKRTSNMMAASKND